MPGGGAPVGAGSGAAGAATPVTDVNDVGGADWSTQETVLTDARPFAQILGSDSSRRKGSSVIVDPTFPAQVRVFLCSSALDAQQGRNGIPMFTQGPIYGWELDVSGGSVWAYVDAAAIGTLDANGGLSIYAMFTTGVNPVPAPAPKPSNNPLTADPTDDDDST